MGDSSSGEDNGGDRLAQWFGEGGASEGKYGSSERFAQESRKVPSKVTGAVAAGPFDDKEETFLGAQRSFGLDFVIHQRAL